MSKKFFQNLANFVPLPEFDSRHVYSAKLRKVPLVEIC